MTTSKPQLASPRANTPFLFTFRHWGGNMTSLDRQFSLQQYWKQYYKRAEEAYYKALTHFYVLVGSANFIAYSYYLNVCDELEEYNLIPDKHRRYLTDINYRYESYYKALDKALSGEGGAEEDYKPTNGRSALWKDITIQMDEIIRPEIDTLFKVTEKWLDEHGKEEDNEVAAACLVVGFLFDAAATVFRDFFSVVKAEWSGHDLAYLFRNADFTPLRKSWNHLADRLVDTEWAKDIVNDDTVFSQYKKILHMMCDEKFIDKASNAALKFDPNLRKYAKE